MQNSFPTINVAAIRKRRSYGAGSLFLRGKTWWIQIRTRDGRYRESSKSHDRGEANNLLRQRLGELASNRLRSQNRVTISDLCELVVNDYRLHQRRDIDHVIWRSDKHVRPLIGNVQAVQFHSAQLEEYVAARRRAGASDSTINRELAIIRRGFSLALRREPPLLSRAPFIDKLQEGSPREGFLEDGQYVGLRNELPGQLKCLFVSGFHLGCRKGELLKVRTDQVDLAGSEIRLTQKQTKNKRARTLPIYGEMRVWIEMQLSELDQHWPACPWLFHRNGRKLDPHLNGWKEACKRAGVPNLLFHDLRRTAIRNMERAGIPRRVAMEISGHRTEAVYRRYDIVSSKDLRLAATKMETYFEEHKTAEANKIGHKLASPEHRA